MITAAFNMMDRLENLALELKQGVNAAWGIYTAMTESSFSPEEYTDGLYCVVNILEQKSQELTQLVQGLFDAAKSEGGEV